MKRSLQMMLQLFAGLALAMAWVLLTGATGVHAQPLTCSSVLPTPTDIAGLSDGYTSADGCYTVYDSKDYTLLPGETYHYTNVFVYNRVSGATVRVSLKPDGTPLVSTASLNYLDISPNGRYVLIGNWYNEVYLHDRDADSDGTFDEAGAGNTSNILLPMDSGGIPLQPEGCGIAGTSGNFSADGTSVVFGRCYGTSYPGTAGVFVYTIASGTSNKITDGLFPHMSGNGRYIIYSQQMLVPSTGMDTSEIFRWDRDSNGNGVFDDSVPTPQLASVNDQGDPANWGVWYPNYRGEISSDGRYVAFDSDSTNLVTNDTNAAIDVFVHDFVENKTARVSLSYDGHPLNEDALLTALSSDGRYVSYTTSSDTVVSWDDNQAEDVFLRDIALGTNIVVTGKADHNLDVFKQERPSKSLVVSGPTEGGLDRDLAFTAVLDNQSRAQASSFTWQITDAGAVVHTGAASSDRVSVQWSTPGTKTLVVTASTPDGPVSASYTFTVYGRPVADFTADVTDGTDLLTSQFTNLSTGEYRSVFWDFGDYGSGGDTVDNPSYDFEPGTYTVSLTVTGPGGSSTKVRKSYIQVQGNDPRNYDRSFVQAGSLGLPTASYRSADWGDFDQDGDQDLLISGCLHITSASYGCDQPLFHVYRNNRGTYTDTHVGLKSLDGYAKWVDINHDGRLDIAISGIIAPMMTARTVIYQQLPDGHFLQIATSLPRTTEPAPIEWVDYNGDHLPDAVIGYKLYKNLGNFSFQDASISFAQWDSSGWGDFDDDGDPDLLTTGLVTNSSTPITMLYRNDGSAFTEIVSGLPNLKQGSISWVDYDGDQKLELQLSGQSTSGGVSHLYRYQAGGFVEMPIITPDYLRLSQWADYDQDGDLDLLSSTNLYRNDAGGFTLLYAGNTGMGNNQSDWVDYNQDGVLDYVRFQGTDNETETWGVARFYFNTMKPVNNFHVYLPTIRY